MLARVGSSRREHLRPAAARKYHRTLVRTDELLVELDDEYRLDWAPHEYGWCYCCTPDWWALSLTRERRASPQPTSTEEDGAIQLASWLEGTNELTPEVETWQLPGFEEARRQLQSVKSAAFQAWRKSQRGAAHCLLLLFPFWIRSPLDWRPDERPVAHSMGLHLLAHYPVPPALLSCFHTERFRRAGYWMVWLLLYGQGISPLKVARRLGQPQLPSRTYRWLFDAPAGFPPEQALAWAEARRVGASERVAQLLASNGWTLFPDYGDEADWIESLDQLRQVTSWLVRHIDQLDDQQVGVVLAWVRHRYAEAHAGHAPPLSLRRRTVESVVSHAFAYKEALIRAAELREALTWQNRGWDWCESTPEGTWSLRELCSARELADERIVMKHWVALYAERCAVGSSAVFSLSVDGARVATVELAPHARRVVQARGENGRLCNESERAVIDRWLAALGMKAFSG